MQKSSVTEALKEFSAVADAWGASVANIRCGDRSSAGFLVRENLVATTAHTLRSSRTLEIRFGEGKATPRGGACLHPKWTLRSTPQWNVALVRIDPLPGEIRIVPAEEYDVKDPVVVLARQSSDADLEAHVGTIDAVALERGAEILFVSGLTFVVSGAPAFNRDGLVVGMVCGSLVDPRGPASTPTRIAAVLPINVIMSLIPRT